MLRRCDSTVFSRRNSIGLTAAAVVALAGALLVLLRLPTDRVPATEPTGDPRPTVAAEPVAA